MAGTSQTMICQTFPNPGRWLVLNVAVHGGSMHPQRKLNRWHVKPQWRPPANTAAVGVDAIPDNPGRP
jgi:hypothetical protein